MIFPPHSRRPHTSATGKNTCHCFLPSATKQTQNPSGRRTASNRARGAALPHVRAGGAPSEPLFPRPRAGIHARHRGRAAGTDAEGLWVRLPSGHIGGERSAGSTRDFRGPGPPCSAHAWVSPRLPGRALPGSDPGGPGAAPGRSGSRAARPSSPPGLRRPWAAPSRLPPSRRGRSGAILPLSARPGPTQQGPVSQGRLRPAPENAAATADS